MIRLWTVASSSLRKPAVAAILLVGSGAGVAAWKGLHKIPHRHLGIVTDAKNTVCEPLLHPGWHWVNPLTKMLHPWHLQSRPLGDQLRFTVKSEEGLDFDVRVSVRYSIIDAPAVVALAGIQLEKQILIPRLDSIVRDVASQIKSSDLHHQRLWFRSEIERRFRAKAEDLDVSVDELLLHEVSIPRCIEDLIRQEQKAKLDVMQTETELQLLRLRAAALTPEAINVRNLEIRHTRALHPSPCACRK